MIKLIKQIVNFIQVGYDKGDWKCCNTNCNQENYYQDECSNCGHKRCNRCHSFG